MIALMLLAMQSATGELPVILHPTQAKLDIISDACRTPRKWLRHLGGDEVQIKPAKTAKYEQVDCVLAKLKATDISMKFGFIGNEQALETEKK